MPYYALPQYELELGLDPEDPWNIYDMLPWEGFDWGWPRRKEIGHKKFWGNPGGLCNTDVVDAFDRTYGGGWGTATNGPFWRSTAGPIGFSGGVTGEFGWWSGTRINLGGVAYGWPVLGVMDIYFEFNGSNIKVYGVAGPCDLTEVINTFWAEITSSGGITVSRHDQEVSGSGGGGPWCAVRYYCDPWVTKVKAWPSSGTEPVGWQVVNTLTNRPGDDNTAGFWSLYSSGNCQVRNLRDLNGFYPISCRTYSWDPIYRDTSVGWTPPFKDNYNDWGDGWVTAEKTGAETYYPNSQWAGVLWANGNGPSSSAVNRSGLPMSGNFSMRTRITFGMSFPSTSQDIQFTIQGDGGTSSWHLSETNGSVLVTGSSSASVAGYTIPDTTYGIYPSYGGAYNVRWDHYPTRGVDRWKVWPAHEEEPDAWTVSGASLSFGAGSTMTIRFSCSAGTNNATQFKYSTAVTFEFIDFVEFGAVANDEGWGCELLPVVNGVITTSMYPARGSLSVYTQEGVLLEEGDGWEQGESIDQIVLTDSEQEWAIACYLAWNPALRSWPSSSKTITAHVEADGLRMLDTKGL